MKWNIQEAVRRSEDFDKEYERLKEVRREAAEKIEEHIIMAICDYICNTINLIPNPDKAYEKSKIIYNKAYERCHVYGLKSVLAEVENLVDFLESVMK